MILFGNDCPECLKNQSNIEEERMTFYIFEIKAQFILHNYLDIIFVGVVRLFQQFVLVTITDGCHIGYARSDIENVHLLGSIHIHIFPHLGTWSDKAHVADENIYQLRQFIEFVLADKISGAGNTRVMPADGNKPILIGTDPHRTEFEQFEILIVASDTYLAIKDRSGRIAFYPNSQYQKQRTQSKQSQTACNDIENTFQMMILF